MNRERLAELAIESRYDGVVPYHNFIAGLNNLFCLVRPPKILEIGCHKGVSTEVFCQYAQEVVACDPWPDEAVYEHFCARVLPYQGIINIVRGSSPEALKGYPEDYFDMAYIDGDHTFSKVLADIEICQRLVKPMGLIAGHDFETQCVGVIAAVLKAFDRAPDFLLPESSWVMFNNKNDNEST